MLEIALAKLTSLGLAAKIGVATAAVTAGTVGAGAAGALPGPVQDAVADTVGAVTPFELPSSADEAAEFGQRVAEDAADPDEPGVDGRQVAEEASDGRSSQADDPADEHRPEGVGVDGSEVADDHSTTRGEDAPDTGDDSVADDNVPEDTEGDETGEEASAGFRP